MKFEVYCDEVFPDLFTSESPKARYLMIGSLWLPADLRDEVKIKIKMLREQHNTWGEIKWNKVSTSRLGFYLDLIDLFMGYDDRMRFRCIAVDRNQANLDLHDGDHELGFYRFYYQVLRHWILDFNTYSIFCDTKTNQDSQRLGTMKQMLNYSNLSAEIECVQALPSRQVVLIQLTDLLLGAANKRLNQTFREGTTAKERIVYALEDQLGRQLTPTSRGERKFNIFKVDQRGGW